MQHRPFQTTTLPRIGQGTWQMEADERASCISAIQSGIDAGLTHIDTAEMYGAGSVEEMVGEAIRGRPRDALFLTSKVLPENASREGSIAACERSLKRLGVERLDLYLLHWASEHPLEDTIAAFETLVAAGKIARWGVSNFDVPELTEAQRIAGPGKIACNQVLYHLNQRAIEAAVLPWCEANGVAVVAYSPFGSGRFPLSSSRGGRALEEIADARSATAHQVALAFLTRRPSVFAIPKSSRPTRATENAKAGDLTLSSADISNLDAAFPMKPSRTLPTL